MTAMTMIDAFVVRRRNIVGLVTSAACHALLFGLGAIVLTRPLVTRTTTEAVEVDLLEARPDPVRDVPSALQNEPPTPPVRVATAPAITRTRPKSAPRPLRGAPTIALAPSSETAPGSDVSIPVIATLETRRDMDRQTSPSPGTRPAPMGGDGPITVLATPRYRSNPRPEYPIVSKRRHEEGEVRLTVAVSPEGHVLHVSLLKSSGHPLLDQAAIQAVHDWTFEPARASGVPVASQVVVPVRYSLSQE